MSNTRETDYRLSERDEERVRAAVRHRLTEWAVNDRRGTADLARRERETLRRVAAHSLTLAWHELTDTERQYVDNEIGEWELGMKP